MTRVRITGSAYLKACPKCKRKDQLVALSQQTAEDSVDVWIECDCGYSPFGWDSKIETVWGINEDTVVEAAYEWNRLVEGE